MKKEINLMQIFIAVFCLLLNTFNLIGQNNGSDRLNIERVVFRPAQWEEQHLIEKRNERPNRGGLIFVYYKNISDQAIQIARFLINKKEEGFYTQSGNIAWTRHYGEKIYPGETKVYEINAVSGLFSEGKDFSFNMIDRKSWSAIASAKVVLEKEPLQITSIIWQEGLTRFTLHLQNNSDVKWDFKNLIISGKKVIDLNTTGISIEPRGHMVLSGKVDEPFSPGSVCVATIELKSENEHLRVMAHRTSYDSYFAIGTWGVEKHRYEEVKNKLHLNTFIRGGKSTDEFYSSINKDYGFKVLTHTGMYPDIDKIKDLKDIDDVVCWYLQDEPDANKTAEAVLFSNEMTKKYSPTKPTMVTLCRNVRFFEFAFIPDVACMDHYSVGAPTSSIWPYPYGTKLEETGYYTRDLKLAAYPKPIWVWSQGLFNWDERPKQQVPSARELSYQLFSNIGNGAKGILWFTIKENKAKQYPESYLAMQQCGRILEMLKIDLLEGDPLQTTVESNSKFLFHPIISKDKLVLIVLNRDYTIDPVAYQWNAKQNVAVNIRIPSWLSLKWAYELIPEKGVDNVDFLLKDNRLNFTISDIEAYKIYVFDTKYVEISQLQAEYDQLSGMEK